MLAENHKTSHKLFDILRCILRIKKKKREGEKIWSEISLDLCQVAPFAYTFR